MFGANVNAGRFEADIDAMRTIIAFRGRMFGRFHIESVIRACLCARLTADTTAIVKIDDAVLSCKQCRDGTDLDARRIGAMVAAHNRKEPARVRKRPLLNVLDPRAIHANRNLVFRLACNSTGVAADTFSVVDYESKIHLQDFTKLLRG